MKVISISVYRRPKRRGGGLWAILAFGCILWIVMAVVLVKKLHGQVWKDGVVGQAYDRQGIEFPEHPKFGQTWEYLSGRWFKWDGKKWAPLKPKLVDSPKVTPMYACPYGQHYHPLAKDVVTGDQEMWKHPDVQTQTIIPVLDGKCHSYDFDEALSDRGKRVTK